MEINFKNVCYRYKNKRIFDHLTVKIEDNRLTGIIGEYKTLFCEMIDAVKPISNGTITVGTMVLNKDNLKTIRKEVCLIHQSSKEQFFTNNVKDEMLFLMSRLDYKPRDLNKKMTQSLLLVGLDKSCLKKEISTLSNGEKKLLQVAIGLISNPNVIIFDEPFIELDYINKKKLVKLIKMLKEKYSKTIIIASNDSNCLYELTDNIIILKKGRILIADNTVKVYQNIDLLVKNELDVPDLVTFTVLARQKQVKLSYHRDIRDLIKDVYKHV